jgi:hypothetical protein
MMFVHVLRVFLLAVLLVPTIRPSLADKPTTNAPPLDYLAVVRGYADAMLEHGRDRYGKTHTPLFASFLKLDGEVPFQPEPGARNATTRTLLPPFNLAGYRAGDRMWTASNVMHDQNLYQVLYALTKITGKRQYASEADRALKWFLENCQSAETGLLGWGEHLGYDLWEERIGCSYYGMVTEKGPKPDHYGGIHEFYRAWALWPRCYQLAPTASEKFARGLWDNQVVDKNTGAFSRHAYFSWRAPGGGYEFPRHGGFYIHTWARAYERTKDKEYLRAIETLVRCFTDNANPESGAIPAGLGRDVVWLMWPFSNVSLAIDLHASASHVPRDLARKMIALARRIDGVSVRVPHDLKTPGRGFVITADVRTFQPGNPYLTNEVQSARFNPWSGDWDAGYGGGNASHARIAMYYFLRHQQSRVPEHRQLVLAAADSYLADLPRPEPRSWIYPMAMGEVISLLLAAHELSGEKRYLEQADRVGALAVRTYFEGTAIPRVTEPGLPYYESIAGPDTLALALLKLWQVRDGRKKDLSLVWTDR